MKKSGIKFKDNAIKARLKHIREWVNKVCPEYMEKLGDRIRVSIRDRVQSDGMGLKKKLKKYSKRYAKYRKEKGRNTHFRDLTFSGRMLNSLSLAVFKEHTKIFFKGEEEQEKASGNQKRTAFFGIGNAEKKIVKTAIKELMERAL